MMKLRKFVVFVILEPKNERERQKVNIFVFGVEQRCKYLQYIDIDTLLLRYFLHASISDRRRYIILYNLKSCSLFNRK